MCRQFIREFFKLDVPIIMVASSWTESDVDGDESKIKIMTLKELLPMSFGPEDLERPRGLPSPH
jgi:cytidine deaminase